MWYDTVFNSTPTLPLPRRGTANTYMHMELGRARDWDHLILSSVVWKIVWRYVLLVYCWLCLRDSNRASTKGSLVRALDIYHSRFVLDYFKDTSQHWTKHRIQHWRLEQTRSVTKARERQNVTLCQIPTWFQPIELKSPFPDFLTYLLRFRWLLEWWQTSSGTYSAMELKRGSVSQGKHCHSTARFTSHDELKNEVACWIPSETDKINLAFLAYKQLTDTKAYRSFL